MDKLTVLETLEWLAGKLRALGLHPVTRLGRYVLYTMMGNMTVQVDGLSLTGSVLHRGYLASLRKGTREAYMVQLFKEVLRPGMVVCDIGSYIGYYALLAARCIGESGKVFAFEPDLHNFAYLVRNIQDNRLESIVVPVQKAVSDRTELRVFYIRESDRSTNSLFLHEGDVRQVVVETVSLDEFLDDRVESIDVIKIDIEGGELHALKGMERILNKSPVRVMFVECNPKALQAAGADAGQLVEALMRQGFSVHIIDEEIKGLCPVSEEIKRVKHVNLFCRRCNE